MAFPAKFAVLAVLVQPSLSVAQDDVDLFTIRQAYSSDRSLKTSTSCLPTRKPPSADSAAHVVRKVPVAETSIVGPVKQGSAPPGPTVSTATTTHKVEAAVPGDPIVYTAFPSDPNGCCPVRRPKQAVFAFGGIFTNGSMGDTTRAFRAPYDGNTVFGVGYRRFRWEWGRWDLGGEIGLAGRFGDRRSAELWAGPVLRYDGFVLADRVKITPSFTAGFSAVTDTMAVENDREEANGGHGALLFYLGPDIALSLTSRPNFELFYRLHHRSGADGRLGGLREGYNANVIGVRYRY